MEVKMRSSNNMIHVDFGDIEFSSEEAVSAVEALYNLISGKESIAQSPKIISNKDVQKNPDNDFSIRDRLPNNAVDVASLDIKQAVTENTLVRCPHCGQAHCLIIYANGIYNMMRKNYDKKEFEIVCELEESELENALCPLDRQKEYFDDLQEMVSVFVKDFVADNETQILCPVCRERDTFIRWKDAYENPLSYSEYDSICDVCGGEVSVKISKGHKVNVCNTCHKEVEAE